MLNRTDIQPIGLDLGLDRVRLLQLAVSGNTLCVHEAASADIPADTKPESLLDTGLAIAAGLLKRNAFSGRAVVAALPRDIIHVKNLRLPPIPTAELAAAVRFEARNIFPFDTEMAHVEFLPAGEVRQGTDARQEVIVLAARMNDVDGFLEHLDRHGLIVASLDAEPCALYRSVERFVRRRDDEQEVNVLLDVGLVRTHVLIGRGRELSFFKPIDIGGQKLNDAVARRLGITYEEAVALRRQLAEADMAEPGEGDTCQVTPTGNQAVQQAVFHATRGILEDLAREVSLCLRYYSVTFRGPGPARVRLMGREGIDPGLAAVLRAMLSIPAEPAQPFINVDCTGQNAGDLTQPLCEWSMAMGLALKKTPGRFAARDGKPRQNRGTMGEVIDLNQAVAGAAESKPPPDAKPSAADNRTQLPEVRCA